MVFKGLQGVHLYICITVNWTDDSWTVRSTLLDLTIFETPRNSYATCNLLHEFLEWCGLIEKLMVITTDNRSGIFSGVSRFHHGLFSYVDGAFNLSDVYVRCIGHVVKLAVKKCMKIFHGQFATIRSLLSSVRPSVKRRDLFETVKVELGITNVQIPGLDVETRWSSTSDMLTK